MDIDGDDDDDGCPGHAGATSDDSSGSDDDSGRAAPAATDAPRGGGGGAPQLAGIFLGKRDATTRESAKQDRGASIRRTMSRNPGWVPVDGLGHRVHVDPKTKQVKRVVASRLPCSGAVTGDDAIQRYARPIPEHHEQFARLEAANASFEPGAAYTMDSERARVARGSTGGFSRGAGGRGLQYDGDTHAASKAGFVMIRGGIGFVHTSGGVCRFGAPEAGEASRAHAVVCPCGMMHVS